MEDLNKFKVNEDTLISLIATALFECYGISSLSSNSIQDSVIDLISNSNYYKGININMTDDGVDIDVYVILIDGFNVSKIVEIIQNRIKYSIENTLKINVLSVNVHIKGIKVL